MGACDRGTGFACRVYQLCRNDAQGKVASDDTVVVELGSVLKGLTVNASRSCTHHTLVQRFCKGFHLNFEQTERKT